MNRVIIFVALLLYVVDFPLMTQLYPDVSKDYYVYIEFVRVRNILYEFTLFWLVFLAYRLGDRVIKSVSVAGMVLIVGSLIDKVVFKIHNYLFSDVVLIALSLLLAIRTYKNERTQ